MASLEWRWRQPLGRGACDGVGKQRLSFLFLFQKLLNSPETASFSFSSTLYLIHPLVIYFTLHTPKSSFRSATLSIHVLCFRVFEDKAGPVGECGAEDIRKGVQDQRKEYWIVAALQIPENKIPVLLRDPTLLNMPSSSNDLNIVRYVMLVYVWYFMQFFYFYEMEDQGIKYIHQIIYSIRYTSYIHLGSVSD